MSGLRSNFGVAFSNKDKDMGDGFWGYDSRKKKWTVDVRADPKHLDVFELDGGTKFTKDKGASTYTEEILFRIEHKMPFPPEFLSFFYTVDAPAGESASIGTYTQNRAFMLTNAASTGEEGLFAQVDDTYFYIKHFVETFGSGSGDHTFHGSDYLFRFRYEILNQPALYFGNKGY